jgi:hypothetical protein
MPTVGDYVLDNGLAALKSGSTDVNINTAEPSTYTAATSGATFLGKKTFGAGNVFPAAIAAGSPNGRKVTTAAVTDGAISTGGSAGAVSVTDNTNSRLHVTTTLSAAQTVTSGNPFTLNAFDVRLPGA